MAMAEYTDYGVLENSQLYIIQQLEVENLPKTTLLYEPSFLSDVLVQHVQHATTAINEGHHI